MGPEHVGGLWEQEKGWVGSLEGQTLLGLLQLALGCSSLLLCGSSKGRKSAAQPEFVSGVLDRSPETVFPFANMEQFLLFPASLPCPRGCTRCQAVLTVYQKLGSLHPAEAWLHSISVSCCLFPIPREKVRFPVPMR